MSGEGPNDRFRGEEDAYDLTRDQTFIIDEY